MKFRYIVIALLLLSCTPNGSKSKSIKMPSEDVACDSIEFYSVREAFENKNCAKLVMLVDEINWLPIDSLKELPNLERLFIQDLDSLPMGIGELVNIKELSIGHGGLRYIDPAIGELGDLERLNLLYNKLKTVPKEICKLKKLTFLNLTGNQLESLPDCICEMKGLKKLGLRYDAGSNHIDSLEYLKLKACLPGCFVAYGMID